MKDELGRKITKEFVGLIAKIYSYLTDDSEDEESKYTKKENLNLKIIKSVQSQLNLKVI